MFIECEFPKTISYKAQGGPAFNTTVNSGFSGFEQRNQNWQTARGTWTVSLQTPGASADVNPQTYIDMLQAFFLNVGGKASAFRLKDHKDFTNGATAQLIGSSDGVVGHFQLVKNYPSGAKNYQRIITKPVTSLVVDYLGNALLDTVNVSVSAGSFSKQAGYKMGGSGKYCLDETTGTVSFGNPAVCSITKWDVDPTDGNVRVYFTQAGGVTPVKNEQLIIQGASTTGLNGSRQIIQVGTGFVKLALQLSGGTVDTATAVIGWAYVVITGITAASGGSVTYSYSSFVGVNPTVGQRLNVSGLSGSHANGSAFITAVDLVGKTITVFSGFAPATGTNAGLASTDWVPASGAGLISATFQYDYPVRFDTDELMIQLEESDVQGGQPIVTWNAITLREVRILAGSDQG